ncbi:hypothetical protein EVAR_61436_1 [Eumeta japonica]|uniref:Uncharacterized protein n=1 Tax=Eumeta variegata TaxID=151549 RepID=A0A4C1Y2T4_EUMVA|nr:hypothetical protein EVAR_61436_1 [Eumeta japonica]
MPYCGYCVHALTGRYVSWPGAQLPCWMLLTVYTNGQADEAVVESIIRRIDNHWEERFSSGDDKSDDLVAW